MYWYGGKKQQELFKKYYTTIFSSIEGVQLNLVLEPEAKILEVVTTQRDKGYHTFLESYKCLFSNAVW